MSSPIPLLIKIGSFLGQDVFQCKIECPQSGVSLDVMNYGAAIRDWQIPMADGSRRSVVLGFDQFEHYPKFSPFFGAIVGRVANRIGGAKFTLDGQEYLLPANEGKNHLHGGPVASFGKRLWQIKPLSTNSVQLDLQSADGDGGYPGNLNANIVYKLNGNRLTIEFEAQSDRATPVNLVQHNYFNLAGQGDVRGHSLQILADSFTPTTPDLVPTGAIQPLAGTELDFRAERGLKAVDGSPLSLDNNFVLKEGRNVRDEPVAILTSPDHSLRLRLWTDQPGLHVYTGGGISIPSEIAGLHGQRYARFGAICLEDQNFPDAVNHPNFPSPIIRPNQTYRHWCQIEIA